ncbi:MAG: PAS domain S-box protein [Phormidesmis sp.]
MLTVEPITTIMSSIEKLGSETALDRLEGDLDLDNNQRSMPNREHSNNLVADHLPSKELLAPALSTLDLATGIGLISAERKWIQVDDIFCSILGYTPDELLGQTIRDILHPEDWKNKYCLAEATWHEEATVYQEEIRFLHKQGHTVHVFLKALSTGYSARGSEQPYLVIQIQDALKIKKIKSIFHQSRLRRTHYAETQALLKGITDVIVVRDAEGRCLRILPTQTHNLYRPASQTLGRTLHDTLPKTRADVILGYIKQALDTQQPVKGKYELIIKGRLTHISAVFSPIGFNQVLIITHDVTELKKIEEQLAIHALITNKIAEGICLIRSSDGVIVYTNPKFEEMFGYGFCELIGEPIELLNYSDTYIDGKEVAYYLMGEIERHGKFTYEVNNVKKDGSLFWCRATGSMMHHPDHGTVYVVIQTDITAEKKAQANINLLKILTEDMRSAETFETSLNRVLKKVAKVHGWIYGEAWVPTADEQMLTCSPAFYSCIEDQQTDPEISLALERFRRVSEAFTFTPGEGLPGRVWESQQPEWDLINEAAQSGLIDVSTQAEAVFLRWDIAEKCGMKAALGVPLIAEGKLIAVLTFFKASAVKEDTHLIANLSAVACQINLNIQRKRATHELSKAKALNGAILQAMQEAALIVREDGSICALNFAATSLTGYDLDEHTNLSLSQIFRLPEKQSLIAGIESRLQLRHLTMGIESEAVLTSKEGQEMPIHYCANAIRVGDDAASVEYLAGAVIVLKPLD